MFAQGRSGVAQTGAQQRSRQQTGPHWRGLKHPGCTVVWAFLWSPWASKAIGRSCWRSTVQAPLLFDMGPQARCRITFKQETAPCWPAAGQCRSVCCLASHIADHMADYMADYMADRLRRRASGSGPQRSQNLLRASANE